ncbi:MAG: hypothetical protein ABI220_04060 [Candidatus Saccharimonadales bacterium]
MLKQILSIIMPPNPELRRAEQYRNVIRHFARQGGEVFGPIPAGRRREFFCLDEHTWVWHEEWTDENSIRRAVTTRYDVRPNGILKAQDGQPYQPLSGDETRRLLGAARQYRQLVANQVQAA